MRYAAGVDLGSTTTKAILLDEDGKIVGQGITNSRSNYEVACAAALEEARLGAVQSRVAAAMPNSAAFGRALQDAVRLTLYGHQLASLRTEIEAILSRLDAEHRDALAPAARTVLDEMESEAGDLYGAGASRKSDFFRDLAGERFLGKAERLSAGGRVSFERLVGLYDRAVLIVETQLGGRDPDAIIREAWPHLRRTAPAGIDVPTQADWDTLINRIALDKIVPSSCAGTGYGRQTLPFPAHAVRSEILCHGRGAHWYFPKTRTVLDIGGQDTKAIHIDENGVVTAFQMNDRCAAGCGRYLGYIADELNLGLHELGPLALTARRTTRVNSTCTVFAGAELRDRLGLGERREDILAGLHRAIMLRALSLMSRAGGVKNEFTFTGGVCKNPAATKILGELVRENYGEDIVINIHPDSIYMGALGAALFALDDLRAERMGPQPSFVTGVKTAEASQPVAKPMVAKAPAIAAKEGEAAPVADRPVVRAIRWTNGLTAGVDVGASAVKVAIVASDGNGGEVVVTAQQRIRRRLVSEVARATLDEACERAGVTSDQLLYIASTGDGDAVPFRTGHFYGMTAHARGALHLVPESRGALDVGALHARAIRMDERGRVLGQRMTSQCASGTGQFLENVARYLGVPLEDVGELSLTGNAPESVSSICAVLSETDVINMVSRGISTANILQGIHVSIASRLVKLVASAKIVGDLVLTGGLALDRGLVAIIEAELRGERGQKNAPPPVRVRSDPNALYAGAIGAGFLGALRRRQLAARDAERPLVSA